MLRFHHAITDGIGSTEMMHIFISAAGDDIRPGSTGKAVPGYIATVLDDAGNPMDEGTGRLAIKGPTGCRYLDDVDRQRTYVQDGWNVAGDAYVQDEDGYFWYQARTDDMIISGGVNIYPAEIESALLTHPAVADAAADAGADVHYIPSVADVPGRLLGLVVEGDLVLTLGAGDITEVGPVALERLRGGRV